MIGFRIEKALPNFRGTDPGLAELPRDFNDQVLPMNEFELLRGNAKERRQRLREFAYGFAEGHGTTYSKLSPASESDQGMYNSIIIANGEKTSDELAMNAGELRTPGECWRWMDVPATERDCPDVFDLAPEFNSLAERASWYSSTCAANRNGCKRHHRVALDHFINKVVPRRREVRSELLKLRNSFVNDVTVGETDVGPRHMAMNFGHLYAAGVLAVRLKTVPWSEKLVLKCVRRCYRAARREIKTEAELLRRALKRLSVRAKKRTILEKGVPISLTGVDGFRRNNAGQTTVTVRAEAFKTWFDDPRQPRLVLEWLRKQGRLPNCPPAPKAGHAIVWAETQPNWPDGSRPRSIVITFNTTV